MPLKIIGIDIAIDTKKILNELLKCLPVRGFIDIDVKARPEIFQLKKNKI